MTIEMENTKRRKSKNEKTKEIFEKRYGEKEKIYK